MQVIPVINCETEECVKERLDVFRNFGSDWVKFDISDGKFNPVVSWDDPSGLISNFQFPISNYNVEVHLMVEEPVSYVKDWLDIGAKRIIVHWESKFNFGKIQELCKQSGAEFMIALNPDTQVKSLTPILDEVSYVQFLAVTPGYSGQKFQDKIVDKIKALRAIKPDVKIEVDGGINEKTAKLVKEAGADIIVSSSFIFGAENPKDAFQRLKSI